MLYIHFNNQVPNEKKFEYSIMGNNQVDVVKFDISNVQLDFEPTNIYVKVQTKDKRYVDKIALTNESGTLTWNLLAKTTAHKVVECQLSFEDRNDNYYQTEMFELTLKPNINADGTIENDYPSVLQDFEERIEALEQGGGGESGGSNEVTIERVWLSYSKDLRWVVKADVLARLEGADEDSKYYVNDSTRIWVNFKTSPISSKIENEIKNGRFIIRLDYPTKNKGGVVYNRSSSSRRKPTRDYGIGVRGYAHCLGEVGNGTHKQSCLLNSLIFVNESDIKTNRYGEKYVHKQVSLYDYIKNMCVSQNGGDNKTLLPITLEDVNNNVELAGELEQFCISIPSLNEHSSAQRFEKYMGFSRAKRYLGRYAEVVNYQNDFTNSKKLNPAFRTYTPLYFSNFNGTFVDLFSPYWNGDHKLYKYAKGESRYLVRYRGVENFIGKKARLNCMVAKPRCAILSDNYESDDYSFLKTFPQSDQQIKLNSKAMIVFNTTPFDVLPVFTISITPK